MDFLKSMLLPGQTLLTSNYQSSGLPICNCLEVIEQAQPLLKGKRCLHSIQIDAQSMMNMFALLPRKERAEGRPLCRLPVSETLNDKVTKVLPLRVLDKGRSSFAQP